MKHRQIQDRNRKSISSLALFLQVSCDIFLIKRASLHTAGHGLIPRSDWPLEQVGAFQEAEPSLLKYCADDRYVVMMMGLSRKMVYLCFEILVLKL